MSKRKKIRNIQKKKTDSFPKQIEKLTQGLFYISETDAEIFPFIGSKTDALTKETILIQTNNKADMPVEERDFQEFFAHLTEIQDWFGVEEKQFAKKFAALKNLLEKKLKNLHVFKLGSIELDIYVVGLNEDGILMGIRTKAVET